MRAVALPSKPASADTRWTPAGEMRNTPAEPPAHTLPSRAPVTASIGPGTGVPVSSAQTTKRNPSKRTSPVCVPSHRYPSRSCVMANTSPGDAPVSADQAVSA